MTVQMKKSYVIMSVVLCALAMSIVDGIIQPGYAIKSVVKIYLFLLVPIMYFLWMGELKTSVHGLFIPSGKALITALVMGVLVYGIILGGYHLINHFYDLSPLVLDLTAQNGVNAGNFVYVSLYISFVNSLLEEFMFRGFAFLSLKRLTSRRTAYLFSAVVFAFYHFGMIAGNINIPVWILSLLGLTIAGLVLNYLNEKSGSIITSWLVHMFANFAINTAGFLIFGIL